MTMTETTITQYRDLPVSLLFESTTNPRRHFDEAFLNELAASIGAHGVLSPLLVRPKGDRFEIVFGAQRFRAAQIAESATVPVSIREMTDAQVLEAQLVENLQRRDVHPLEEAQGFAALLKLDEPKYSVAQIAAKCGKTAAYITARLKLAELSPVVVEAFTKEEIGVGHALLLAKLQPEHQEEALAACYQESYGSGGKPKRILLPVRHLQQWIQRNILLDLAVAPFSREDAQLVPEAGSCLECPKRTGHNRLLFAEISANQPDSCSDPKCYQTKVDAHVKVVVASKPKLVQISTGYGKPAGDSPAIPRNKYVEIRSDKPGGKNERDWPEYKTCKYVTEAIVTDGMEKGATKRVCDNPECPIHHPKRQQSHSRADAAFKAEQEKRRREEGVAQMTGSRVLKAIGDAVPVRLMKRDLLFMALRLTGMLDERHLSLLLRQYGIGKPRAGDAPAKLMAGFLQKIEEGKLGRILIETVILLSMHNQTDTGRILRDAAQVYKVDVDAISAQVKQQFAAKEKPRDATRPGQRSLSKSHRKAMKKPVAA